MECSQRESQNGTLGFGCKVGKGSSGKASSRREQDQPTAPLATWGQGLGLPRASQGMNATDD